MALNCPFAVPPDFVFEKEKEKEKEIEKDSKSSKWTWSWSWSKDEDAKQTKSKRSFPWKAAAGLTAVGAGVLGAVYATIRLIFNYFSTFVYIFSLIFKALFATSKFVVYSPLKFIFSFLFWSLFGSSPKTTNVFNKTSGFLSAETYTPLLNPLHCNNSLALQPWDILTFVPGPSGNPESHSYTLSAPTPHALSFVDLDARDTRVDVFADGAYVGSSSDFILDTSVNCGEDVNKCIELGFSTGMVIIPAGKKKVEVVWSGKDVFPGTDKIVWGEERKRRVMWKKELCLQ